MVILQREKERPNTSDPSGILDIFNDVENLDLEPGMLVYPNPTSGEFTIELEGFGEAEVRINILNIYGSVVYDTIIEKEDGSRKTLNLRGLGIPSGHYYITAKSDDKSAMKRITFSN